jgi:hypothetical protein
VADDLTGLLPGGVAAFACDGTPEGDDEDDDDGTRQHSGETKPSAHVISFGSHVARVARQYGLGRPLAEL